MPKESDRLRRELSRMQESLSNDELNVSCMESREVIPTSEIMERIRRQKIAIAEKARLVQEALNAESIEQAKSASKPSVVVAIRNERRLMDIVRDLSSSLWITATFTIVESARGEYNVMDGEDVVASIVVDNDVAVYMADYKLSPAQLLAISEIAKSLGEVKPTGA